MAKHRLSVPLDDETLEVFRGMAEVMGKSLGSTISDWLAETRDTAQMVTLAVTKAKESPAKALRDLQALAEAAQEKLGSMQDEMRRGLAPSADSVRALKKAASGGDPQRGGVPARRRSAGGR